MLEEDKQDSQIESKVQLDDNELEKEAADVKQDSIYSNLLYDDDDMEKEVDNVK